MGRTLRPDFDPFIMDYFIKNRDEEGDITFGLIPRDNLFLHKSHYYFGLIETAIRQQGFYLGNYNGLLAANMKVRDLIKKELILNE